MKITLQFTGKTYHVTKPEPGAPSATVPGATCPKCKAHPLQVQAAGRGIYETTYDTYVADAVCEDCGEPVGTLRVKMPTIFGIEEDERVILQSGCKVY